MPQLLLGFASLLLGMGGPASGQLPLPDGKVSSCLVGGQLTTSFFVASTQQHAYAVLSDVSHPLPFAGQPPVITVLHRGTHWAEVEIDGKFGKNAIRYNFAPPERVSWQPVASGPSVLKGGNWCITPVHGGCKVTSVLDFDLAQVSPLMRPMVPSLSRKFAPMIADAVRQAVCGAP